MFQPSLNAIPGWRFRHCSIRCQTQRALSGLWLVLLSFLSLPLMAEDSAQASELPADTIHMPLEVTNVFAAALSHPDIWLGYTVPDEIKRIVWEVERPAGESGSASGVMSFGLADHEAMTLNIQPQPVRVPLDEPAELRAAVSSDEPVVYYWYHNGRYLPGNNSPFLSIPAVREDTRGWYTLAVVNWSAGELLLSHSVRVESGGYAAVRSADARGSATLRWMAPEVREDGVPIGRHEIMAYRVYHGSESRGWVSHYHVPATGYESNFEWQIANLTPDLHWFAVTAIDYRGQESEPSLVGYKQID